MPTRVGSHGLPCASAEARLYMMRRLAGQLNAQSWIHAEARRIGVDAALREVAGLGVHADVEPVAATASMPSSAGSAKPRELLPGAHE